MNILKSATQCAMRSMTGFGAGEASTEQWQATVEISAVNRKQLDVSVGLPQSIAAFESDIRQMVSAAVSRGRINARVNLTNLITAAGGLTVDETLAMQYVQTARQLAEKFQISNTYSNADLMRSPGVLKIEEVEVELEDVESVVRQAVEAAVEGLLQMQIEEGAHLKSDLETRLATIESKVNHVQGLNREVVAKYRESLMSRLLEGGLEVDFSDERVLREIALFAEKSDITEEITRIGSHIAQFRKYFASQDAVGRPLDFLCQELNRELNTIGSKANHAGIAQSIVESKTELEKIREQVQNIQ